MKEQNFTLLIRKGFFYLMLFLSIQSKAQTIASSTFEVGNIKTMLNADGRLFESDSTNMFYAPKSGIVSSMYAANLWIGGLDGGGQIHLAAQTYRQSGTDFWPGPLDTITASEDSITMALYNKIFPIRKSEVDSFKAGLGISANILNWPGNGDISKNYSKKMAPYIDVNGDGYYDPYDGDYPSVRGDKMLWFVYNDVFGQHEEAKGSYKLGVEIRASVYGFDCADDTDCFNSFFVHYDIYNRSLYKLNNIYLGTWADIDLGYYADDYLGSMVDLSSFYGYNGDMYDDNGYGSSLAAQSVTILQGPLADSNDGIDNNHDSIIDEAGERVELSHFMYYNNDFSAMGNPDSVQEFYNYMRGMWKDGSPLTYDGNGYGGNTVCNYMFPGNTDTAGIGTNGIALPEWSEVTSGNTPGDRRGLGSVGPLTFSPGQKITFDLAYAFAQNLQNPNDSLSVDLLRSRIKNLREKFAKDSLGNCLKTASIKNINVQTKRLIVAPNPAQDMVTIQLPNANESYNISIKNMLGEEVFSAKIKNQSNYNIDLNHVAKGCYSITAVGEQLYSSKLIIEK